MPPRGAGLGAVTRGTLYLYSERSTVKARNLATDPRVVVHLESGEDVLIMRGTAEDLGAPSSAPPVIAALAVKYTGPEDRQYLPSVDPDFDVLYAIRPRSAMTWRLDNYAPSLRRWSSLMIAQRGKGGHARSGAAMDSRVRFAGRRPCPSLGHRTALGLSAS